MDKVKYAVSFVISGAAYLFGEWDGLMTALIAAIAADYITGITAAAVNKQISSETGARGIAKKVLMLLITAIAHIIDVNVIGDGDKLRTMTVLFYIANEAISVLENAGALGVPLPGKLTAVLEQLKKENGGDSDDKDN